jgi:hypothetical protein
MYGYRFTITQRHVADACTTPYHANKINLTKSMVKGYLCEKTGREEIAKWNKQCSCWQYTIDSVVPITDLAEQYDDYGNLIPKN